VDGDSREIEAKLLLDGLEPRLLLVLNAELSPQHVVIDIPHRQEMAATDFVTGTELLAANNGRTCRIRVAIEARDGRAILLRNL
jgi:hypothetical protein